jgi:hypothetical protein
MTSLSKEAEADLRRIRHERLRREGLLKGGNAYDIDPRKDVPPVENLEEFDLSPDRVEEKVKEKPTREKGKNLVAFPLRAFENVTLETDQRGYLVKGLLPSRGLAVIWGPPKCGKSFWATDLSLHIALGWEYHGRRVQKATVVYIALEGRHGLPARLEAFRQHHGISAAPFYLLTTPLDLASKADALIASIEAQLGETKPGAIVIDTLNRSLVGSESKDEDMARYLSAAGKIEDKFGCLVTIVHHCGIDATRPRGHTSLSGAVEVQLAVKKGGAGEVITTVELAKDFPEGAEIFSRLESVEVGTDPDGDTITSLVVLPAEASAINQSAVARKLSCRQRLALDALNECLITVGTAAPVSLGLPAGTTAAPLNAWREELYARGVIDQEGKNPRSRSLNCVQASRSKRSSGHAMNLYGLLTTKQIEATVYDTTVPYRGDRIVSYSRTGALYDVRCCTKLAFRTNRTRCLNSLLFD